MNAKLFPLMRTNGDMGVDASGSARIKIDMNVITVHAKIATINQGNVIVRMTTINQRNAIARMTTINQRNAMAKTNTINAKGVFVNN
ncbi:hypothetical protein [Lederbergia galactosidilytica]|uniref:hypothetical protein n=1 Tax=Lederbergia galactosidilytica TaxID=217031 RepID=UPI001AE73E91|nr:hypothetical protein [Lederbergia galactosidilytica]